MTALLQSAWQVLTELAPWLLLGSVIAGALHVLLPPGFLQRRLTGRGGVANAVLLGVPLPLCSCGVIPTGLGLKKQGASDGATVGFLISTPQTGVDSVLVTSAMLGLPFALFKLAFAAVTGLVGGWIADAIKPDAAADDAPEAETHGERTLRSGVDHAIELIQSIWRWILVGVLISAALDAFVPPQSLAALSGYGGLVGMAAALVISLPLFVCATASVPIAASLVAAGLPTGAALVFLMAGPATNVATIGAVYRTLGGRQLTVYLSTIILGSIAGGLLCDWMLDVANVARHDHAHPITWWSAASAWILLALFAKFAIDDLRTWRRKSAAPSDAPSISVEVDGMTCAGCAAKLERTLTEDPTVESADVELEPGQVTAHGTVTDQRLRELVRGAGFVPR